MRSSTTRTPGTAQTARSVERRSAWRLTLPPCFGPTCKNGDPGKGATGTSAPLVVKDKVLIGISGGEFGVQCHVTAYDLKSGKQVWRAFSEGPDDQILFDPEKTTDLGKPVGKDSSIKTWQGDQWKIGGGCTWGWMSYDPALNLVYYGSGNPSTWNPKQRPGAGGGN